MSTLRLTTLSNQGGTASVPSDTVINGTAKAWVNFNGTGTVAIRASFNVSSITDNGTGNYTVNFTNPVPDANFATSICADGGNGYIGTTYGQGTSGVSLFIFTDASAFFDSARVGVTIFR
jgi:hypothetical protein